MNSGNPPLVVELVKYAWLRNTSGLWGVIGNGVVICICQYCHTYFSNLLRVFVKVVTSIFVNLFELVESASAGPAYRALMATALLPPLSHSLVVASQGAVN